MFLLRHDRLIGFTPPLTFNRSCNSALKALRRLLGQSLSLSVFSRCCCADAGPMRGDDVCTVQERRCGAPGRAPQRSVRLRVSCLSQGGALSNRVRQKGFPTSSPHPLPSTLSLCPLPSGMRKSPDVSPRRLSDISPQLRQLKYLVVDEAIKEDLKSSRSVEDINSASIEERILRITGYYGYQPWRASHTSESLHTRELVALCGWVSGWMEQNVAGKGFFKSILVL